MKKHFSICLLILFSTLLLLHPAVSVSAASGSASLTGPKTVRSGDTVTLTFNLNGSGLSGASGTLSFDSSQLTLSGTKQLIASPWMVEFNGNKMVAYDNNLSSPINNSKSLFSVTFKVNKIPDGSKITVSYTGVTASDGSADTNIGTVSYSVTTVAALSGNSNLASLQASNAAISPEFSAGNAKYTAEVPFDVAKLDVSAAAENNKAKVSINSPELTPGGTTNVSVTVTAENGAKKTYIIEVKRAQDPNYVPSGDNTLASLAAEGFLLSPVFESSKTEYVIWLPYETDNVSLSATPADSKATVEIKGGDNLKPGKDNVIKAVCTAENGKRKEYIITAKRAAAMSGKSDSASSVDTPRTNGTNAPKNIGAWWIWLLIIIAILCAGAGFGAGYFVRRKNEHASEEEEKSNR